MSNKQQNTVTREKLDALSADIVELASRRAATLLAGAEDDDAFDRGARALRTLMSSAESAARLMRGDEEAKDRQNDDQGSGKDAFTDQDIDAAFRRVSDRVDALRGDDAGRSGGDDAAEDGGAARSPSGDGGEAVGGERA